MNHSHEATNPFNKLPPQNLDAERGVLASILIDSQVLDSVSSVLLTADFYLDAHQKIYAAILTLSAAGPEGIDALTVSAELERRGELAEVGGDAYIVKVLNSEPHAAHAKYYAGIVRDKAKQRGLIYTCTEVLRDAYDDMLPADEILDTAASKIHLLAEARTSTTAERAGSIGVDAMVRLDRDEESGVKTGFSELDIKTNGLKPGDLVILAARPSVGKTAFVGNVVWHMAQYLGVFFASLEMTKAQLFDRALASTLKCEVSTLRDKVRTGNSSEVSAAIDALSQRNITIDDAGKQSVSSIAAQARIMKRKHGLRLVVVDYIQLVRPENRKEPREQQVAQISRDLKGLAKSLGVPVIALAQLNREVAKRPNKTPQLTDLRESGAIEQDADMVLFLDRPALWDSDNHDDEEACLIIGKQRGGVTGKIDLRWHGPSMTFRNPDDGLNTFHDPFNAPGGAPDDVDYQEI